MRRPVRQVSSSALRNLSRLFMLAGAIVVLAGCTSTRSSRVLPNGTANGADIVTASDEPNERRRARLRLELAVGYFQAGQTTVALDEAKQSIAIDPSFADAYNLRGLIYMRLDDPGLAEDSFRRAIALNPREPNTLHNYGWLLCQQTRYGDASAQFASALAVPGYADRAKTLMTQGLCQVKAGERAGAERSLLQAYELDPGNPVVGFNLALLVRERGDLQRAQFYVRRVNNGPSANAETLWLGIKIERALQNREALAQLEMQLRRRFPESREAMALERGSFDD
ncbi:MAG: type IV pilus biogenesis/stability protein PilW [Variovorax sp.]|jgi:type IV pilus assembly protein PilF|nr:MAG: type IV pilus biogenesis/stability protein PilW [Variovorax sp.]